MWDSYRWWKRGTEEPRKGIPFLLIFYCGILSQICYILGEQSIRMSEIEHAEKYNWWLNELESLGVSTLQKHGLNNHKEASD
jgi:hypothetical protein